MENLTYNLKLSYSKWNDLITKNKAYHAKPNDKDNKKAIANNGKFKRADNTIIFISEMHRLIEVKTIRGNSLIKNIYSDIYNY